jgi:hypothetical protein
VPPGVTGERLGVEVGDGRGDGGLGGEGGPHPPLGDGLAVGEVAEDREGEPLQLVGLLGRELAERGLALDAQERGADQLGDGPLGVLRPQQGVGVGPGRLLRGDLLVLPLGRVLLALGPAVLLGLRLDFGLGLLALGLPLGRRLLARLFRLEVDAVLGRGRLALAGEDPLQVRLLLAVDVERAGPRRGAALRAGLVLAADAELLDFRVGPEPLLDELRDDVAVDEVDEELLLGRVVARTGTSKAS